MIISIGRCRGRIITTRTTSTITTTTRFIIIISRFITTPIAADGTSFPTATMPADSESVLEVLL